MKLVNLSNQKKYIFILVCFLLSLFLIVIIVKPQCTYKKSNIYSSLSCGYWHCAVVKNNGSIILNGANWYGQLGDGTLEEKLLPVEAKIENIKYAACGATHTIALKNDGSVWAWGNNLYGQLGDGTNINRINPVQVIELKDIISLACGEKFSLALRKDGSVWAWGNNLYGQLGDGTTENKLQPVKVIGLRNIKYISCGSTHSIAIDNYGVAWSWGNNNSGQLGNGTIINQRIPFKVTSLKNLVSVACGHSHSIALKNDGTIYGWGSNGNGQLGINEIGIFTLPEKITSIDNISLIACGYCHTIALKKDGTVYAWGGGTYLGNGLKAANYKPVKIKTISNAICIAANNDFSMALTRDNIIWSWGGNWKGQLGIGTNIDSCLPTKYGTNNINSIISESKSIKTQLPDSIYKKITTHDFRLFSKQWGIKNFGQSIEGNTGKNGVDINVIPVWNYLKCNKVISVGILDTGIDINNINICSSINVNTREIPNNSIDDDNNGFIDDVYGWNFFNDDNKTFNAEKNDTHGTQVASIISAQNNSNFLGIAPNSKLISLKITEDGRQIDTISILKAIEYAQKEGIDILNCSFASNENNLALKNIIMDTKSLFICAAGNSSKDTAVYATYPACYELNNILSVAAVNNNGELYSMSNYGKNISLAAPGENIITCVSSNEYRYVSGTSMAAPFVTGALALLKGTYLNISNDDLRLAAIHSVTKSDKLKGKLLSDGFINVFKMMEYLSK